MTKCTTKNTEVSTEKSYMFDSIFKSSEQERRCERCGLPIKYFYRVVDESGNGFVVGSECVKILTKKSVSEHIKEIREKEKREELELYERKRLKEIENFKIEHKDLFNHFFVVRDFFKTNNIPNNFVESVSSYYERFETLSLKQLEAVKKFYPLEKLEVIKNSYEHREEIEKMFFELRNCFLGRYDEDFFTSLESQFLRFERLSVKQIEALKKLHNRYRKQIEKIRTNLSNEVGEENGRVEDKQV
jgi:hypothetical protein